MYTVVRKQPPCSFKVQSSRGDANGEDSSLTWRKGHPGLNLFEGQLEDVG
jgi:hypothetical protein